MSSVRETRRTMDHEVQEIIEQVTRRKLCYAQRLLKSAGLPFSGTRGQVRERLVEALEKEQLTLASVKALLAELDVWGNQRLRLCRMPPDVIRSYQDPDAISLKAEGVGMETLLGGEIALVPPADLTPMTISYEEVDGRRLLKLFAAKTRHVLEPQPDIPEQIDEEEHPGVIFLPFRREAQKAVGFAEIDLDTGSSLFSTTLLRRGTRYHAEFEEFFAVFEPFIPLHRAEPIPLFTANRGICHLPQETVRLVSRRARTSNGGKLEGRSHSKKADMRADAELVAYFPVGADATGLHCNCVWELGDGLDEPVHTHVFAPEAEVSIVGQTTEANVRYVLQRILELN